MTVSYSLDVSKARFCGLTKLLARWKGGIYKILWREFFIFCLAYAMLSVTYRRYLNEEQKLKFEKVVVFVQTFTDLIPLSFVLGFYVSLVIGRWWSQYETIPWPDRLCFMIASYVHGSDERSRMIRRTLGRYVILAQVLTFQAVSTAVKRRFPTTQHLVDAGIMTKGEKLVYDKVSFPYGKWWLPCHWFSALATRARKEGRIKDSVLLNGLFQEILNYRNSCAIMFGYDWISVPLVYTQVVTVATYAYTLALIIGKQYLNPEKGYPNNDIDLYIPFFTLLQFFFYVGWLKVAEQILNPYGEDDDDFELNWCLDRGVHIVYLVVDNLQLKHPRVSKDFFWDDTEPVLPQTKYSSKFYTHPQLGSASSLNVEEAEYLPAEALFEEDLETNLYTSDSVKRGENYRPSLIRRLLSSGFGHSRRTKSTQKENSIKGPSQCQGFNNAAFDAGNEKNVVSNCHEPVVSNTSSLNNSVKISPSNSRTTSVSFRPNSLALHRRKTYDVQDAEKAFNQNVPFNSETEHRSSNFNVVPILRSISAPHTVHFEKSPTPPEEDDGFEKDSEDHTLDNTMPSIPEESSRASSLASIEAGSLPFSKSPLKRIQAVHQVVHEANLALEKLNRSAAMKDDDNRDVKGYESCCSTSDGGSSSDENGEEEKTVNGKNTTTLEKRDGTETEVKAECSVVIEIEKECENISVPRES